jgi:hypothetical protein
VEIPAGNFYALRFALRSPASPSRLSRVLRAFPLILTRQNYFPDF